jgi:hypothetical protein
MGCTPTVILGLGDRWDLGVRDHRAEVTVHILLVGLAYTLQQMIARAGDLRSAQQYTFFDQAFTVVSYVGLDAYVLAGPDSDLLFSRCSSTGFPPAGWKMSRFPCSDPRLVCRLGQNPGLILGIWPDI